MREQEYRFLGVSLEEAIDLLKQHLTFDKEKHTEYVPLMEALHRTTAEDCISPICQPPFHRSPVDGYAVRSEDVRQASKENPIALAVIEEIMAGDSPKKPIGLNMASRIMTGAPIPEGADCVVRQEDTDYGDEKVCIYTAASPYQNYCYAGEDFKKGDCLISKDTPITAVELGILASMGYVEVLVYARPRVGLFITGDELMKPGEPLQPGKIYNSNLYVLWGRLKELGMEPVIADCLPDTEEGVAASLEEILPGVDLVITTGGVSVGKKDIMHGALQLLGAEKIFWRVLVKPGTPTIFAVAKGVPIVSLSGNPFGAVTNLELLVRPMLAEMTGESRLIPTRRMAELQNRFDKGGKVRRFIRGKYEDGKVWLPDGLHSSGVLGSMRGCNCLIDMPAGNSGLKEKTQVEVVLID